MGEHRHRWNDHHHVACDRNGARVDDLAAFDRRGRARCGLVEGARRAGAADRCDLRQPWLPGHDVYRRLQCGDELLPAVARLWRPGAPRAHGERRQEARRAARRAQHRAERGRARQVGPQAQLWRDRRLCRGSGQSAGGETRGIEEAERVPAHRQRRAAGGGAGQSQRQRALQHRRAGAEHALRRGPARTGRRFGSGQDRRYKGQGDRRRRQDRQITVWRRRARGDAMGGIRGAPGADPIRDLEQNRHRLGL